MADAPAARDAVLLQLMRNPVQGMAGSVRHVKPPSDGAAFVLSF